MKVLLTGAGGFLGRHLLRSLLASGYEVRAAARSKESISKPEAEVVGGFDLGRYDRTRWLTALSGCEIVVHCAAIAHVPAADSGELERLIRTVNVDGTLKLAELAAEAGVKRFVFLSSIKVNGEETRPDSAYREADVPAPEDLYGRSKLAAENGLLALAERTGLEITIIRPSLVYGEGAKGNLASIQRWLARGLPLPLGAIHNRRTLVGVDNLTSLVAAAMSHPRAANEVFLAGDDTSLSTTELISTLATAMRSRSVIVPVPRQLLELTAGIVGRREQARKLTGSLCLDTSKAHTVLGWKPVRATDSGLIAMAAGYRRH